jgi:hypothetical protein
MTAVSVSMRNAQETLSPVGPMDPAQHRPGTVKASPSPKPTCDEGDPATAALTISSRPVVTIPQASRRSPAEQAGDQEADQGRKTIA